MSDIRLPQRPMVELTPPLDGLDQVRGEAGRRRRRRAGVAAASLTTAAGLAVVVALSGGGAGVDVLKPAPPAGQGIDSPAPSAKPPTVMTLKPASSRHRRAGGQSTVAAAGKAHRDAGSGPEPVAGAQPNANGAAGAPSGGRSSGVPQPTLRRWQSTYTDSPARECAGSEYGDTSSMPKNAVGWCLDVFATAASGGEQLHIRLCRDSTGGGTLNFFSTREVDLAVQQGGKTVWDWASLHPGSSDSHQLSEPANGCMNWALVWTDVTTAGKSAGGGSFTFVGTSTADEMQGNPSASADFAY